MNKVLVVLLVFGIAVFTITTIYLWPRQKGLTIKNCTFKDIDPNGVINLIADSNITIRNLRFVETKED